MYVFSFPHLMPNCSPSSLRSEVAYSKTHVAFHARLASIHEEEVARDFPRELSQAPRDAQSPEVRDSPSHPWVTQGWRYGEEREGAVGSPAWLTVGQCPSVATGCASSLKRFFFLSSRPSVLITTASLAAEVQS